MMKNTFLYLLLCTVFMSIHNHTWAQTENQKAKMIIGTCERNTLKTNEQFSSAYQLHYNEYQADSSRTDSLRQVLSGLKVHIVFGTWCGDSKLQVPRFIKIMDTIGFPEENISYEGVDYAKHTSTPLDIEKVPTFIFYKENKEIYRLIERPKVSLEADILANLK